LLFKECTDAVSVEQEKKLFEELMRDKVTCITISKRVSLEQFHKTELNCGAENENGFVIRSLE
jgi:ABC-type uncharacterized transport system fused permease/ATPase subunit